MMAGQFERLQEHMAKLRLFKSRDRLEAVLQQATADELPYLNFHRPCYFAVDQVDARGRIRKTYPTDQIMTPWERLRSMPDFEQYLKPGVTPQSLEQTALAMTDTQAAQALQDMRRNLFAAIRRKRA